jgi:hypothetical protein
MALVIITASSLRLEAAVTEWKSSGVNLRRRKEGESGRERRRKCDEG